jgi:hypothetical protein
MTIRPTLREKREELAALCHKQWSGWMKHLFSKLYQQPPGFGWKAFLLGKS